MPLRQSAEKFLEKFGQRFHIDAVFYAKIMGWVGVNYVTNVLRGVATTFILARWLSPETFGSFRYIIAIYGIAGTFSFSSYHTGIIRGIAAQDTEVAWSGSKKMMISSLIGSAIILAAAFERWVKGEEQIALCLGVTSLFFPFFSASSLYGSILTGKGEVRTLSKYNSLSNLLFTGLFFATLFFGQGSILLITFAFFGADVFLKASMSFVQLRTLKRQGSAETHLHLGSQLSFMGIFQAFAHQIDQIILQRFFGYTALANYSIAILIPEQITDFIKSFSGILLQRKTSGNLSALKDTSIVRRQMYSFLGFMSLLWLGYTILAPLVMPWLFPQYAAQVWPSILYALGMFGSSAGIGLSWMQARHQIRALWHYSFFNSFIQIIGTCLFTPWLGEKGAVFAKVFTRLASIPLSFPKKTKQDV